MYEKEYRQNLERYREDPENDRAYAVGQGVFARCGEQLVLVRALLTDLSVGMLYLFLFGGFFRLYGFKRLFGGFLRRCIPGLLCHDFHLFKIYDMIITQEIRDVKCFVGGAAHQTVFRA